jgi:non-specific serine/threonine protein kinase
MLSHPLLDAAGRRQTLRTTMDWSYDLLADYEKVLFNRLSVFAGGWTLAAIDALCGELPPDQVLNGLISLADKSLIRQESGMDDEPRFWMLHILREYAQEQLARSAEAEAIGRRHATYFLTRAETAAPELHLAKQEQWLLRLEAEHDNLRLALAWFLANNQVDEALRLVAALGWFWVKQDHHSEGFHWFRRALDQGRHAPPELRAKATLFAGGRLAYFVEQMGQSIYAPLTEALTWAKGSHDRYCEAWALGYLALYHEISAGEYEQAITLFQAALDLFQQERPNDYGTAWVLNALGVVYALRGLFSEAIAHLEASLHVSRHIENGWGTRLALMNLGLVAYQQANYAQARQHFLELLPTRSGVKHHHDLANWLCGLGLVCAGSGQTQQSVLLFSAVARLLTDYVLTLSYPLNHFYEQRLSALRVACDPQFFAEMWDAGQLLGSEDVIRLAQSITLADL